MSPRRGRHARDDDPLETRREMADEAARQAFSSPDVDLAQARREAAERRGLHRHRDRDELPRDEELRDALLGVAAAHDLGSPPDATAPERFEVYRALLEPLAEIELPPAKHPEGDALFHVLQVAELVRGEAPYDEELILAGLLHLVGLTVNRRRPVDASLVLLDGWITPRTAALIEWLPLADKLRKKSLTQGHRAHGLTADDLEDLSILERAVAQGRVRGAKVPALDELLDDLRAMDLDAGGAP